jgi:deazaflavin-dependent oxidoreductase (nitroreductase family)
MPMTSFDRQFGLRLLNLHQFVYERSGGLIGHGIGRLKTLLLRTRGRKSGETRTAALLYMKDRDRYVVVGSKGGSDVPPAWLKNLEADPEVEVQVATRRFPASARVATDAERKRLWPQIVELWPDYARYQSQTERVIPLVILKPRP